MAVDEGETYNFMDGLYGLCLVAIVVCACVFVYTAALFGTIDSPEGRLCPDVMTYGIGNSTTALKNC